MEYIACFLNMLASVGAEFGFVAMTLNGVPIGLKLIG